MLRAKVTQGATENRLKQIRF